MPINIIGDAPTIKRLETGLYSFDRSFENRKGDIGFPLGKGIEVFGATNTGKSTIVYGLAGIIASFQKRNISLADLEGFDPDFLIVKALIFQRNLLKIHTGAQHLSHFSDGAR